MDDNALLISVMRTMGAAWRASRLYPADSPMLLQSIKAVCASVEEYVQAEPSLKLDVVRGGFILRGIDTILTAPGIGEFTDALGMHGVGELHFVAPPEPEEIIAFMSLTQLQAPELLDLGGMEKGLTEASVHAIRVVPVVLNKIELPPEIPEEDADKFLAELAADPGRLAVWLRSLLASDDEGLSEGLRTLADAAGDVRVFGRTMALAFLELETDDKDRLLESSIGLEPIRDITVEMVQNLSESELVAAIRGGRFGKNISAMSFALTGLPARDRLDAMLTEMEAALRAADATDASIAFLETMVERRKSGAADPPLAQAQPVYRQILDAVAVPADRLEATVADARAHEHLDARSVTVLAHLMDDAEEMEPYCAVLDALARSVGHLIEIGTPDVAMLVVKEVTDRSAGVQRPWPGLDARFAAAVETMCGSRTMSALLALSQTDAAAAEYARQLVALGGEPAARSLASVSVESEAENSMQFAEEVLGKRLAELLAPEAPTADPRHAGKMAELFARDGGAWCMQALVHLAARTEDKVRSETARGVGVAGGQALTIIMPKLLRDSSQEVEMVAVRALARNGGPGTTEMIAQRLAELEGDSHLRVAKEIVNALKASPSPVAETALTEVTQRGGFLRRGKDAELKKLAFEALAARKGAKR